MKIEYNGRVYIANDKKEMMKALRESRLTHHEIGQILGYSRSYVCHVLNNEFNMYGELDFPELRNPATFDNRTDEQIARRLSVPVFRVTVARKNLKMKKHQVVRLHRRRRDLVKFLFGKKYNPGDDFEVWFEKAITSLNKRQYEIMKEFYVEGITESIHANINSDGVRVYRSLSRKQLKEEVICDLDVEELVNDGVLSES